jgi:hypothetical protein
MKLLWLDPGGTTGWAVARLVRGVKVIDAVRETLQCGQIPCGLGEPMESAHTWKLMELIADVNDRSEEGLDVVGLEDFRLFPGEDHSPDQKGTTPMRLLAKIDMLWWMAQQEAADMQWVDSRMPQNGVSGIPKLVKQMPGERSLITDELLRRWGLWRTPTGRASKGAGRNAGGGGPHAMDALRHLIVFGRKWVEGKVEV